MALALLCWLLTAMPIGAAQLGACDAETSLQANQESFEVGSINIRRLNVFSEEQAVIWPYGLANKVHVITSDTLIRRQLLFQPGDVIDHHRLLESERWLRRNEYLSSASIRVDEDSKAVCNQPRDLIVTTQDQWSLTPHLSLAVAEATRGLAWRDRKTCWGRESRSGFGGLKISIGIRTSSA